MARHAISRMYQDEEDFARMRRFLQTLPDGHHTSNCYTVGDLDWWRSSRTDSTLSNQTMLWFDGADTERVVGFLLQDGENIEILVHPDYPAVEREMVERLIAHASAGETLSIVAGDSDATRRNLLDQLGFAASEKHYRYHRQPLNDVEEPARLPDGYAFGDMRQATQAMITRRVDVHRAAWGSTKMTEERHRTVMATSTYRADLDLVVVAPDGVFASCAIVWFDPIRQAGTFEPVGCAPDFRQLGLTKALMHEGMRRLATLGATAAYVTSWHESIPANRLYESAGFTLVDRLRLWVKPIEPPVSYAN